MINTLHLKGFRCFEDITFHLSPLEVIVGANGTGKSTLFEFLHFWHGLFEEKIPYTILPTTLKNTYKKVFYKEEKIEWTIEFKAKNLKETRHSLTLAGPVGDPKILLESLSFDKQEILQRSYKESDIQDIKFYKDSVPNKLPATLSLLQQTKEIVEKSIHIDSPFHLYDASTLDFQSIKRPSLLTPESTLSETGSNLSVILHRLMTEQDSIFDQLQHYVGLIIPKFTSLRVRQYGAPGEIMAFWKEEGIAGELTLADLSDGTLRLLCWLTIVLCAKEGDIICMDEPDVGLHPRALVIFAGLIQSAVYNNKAQILLTTHNSYFLSSFELDEIAVMRKNDFGTGIEFLKPKDSTVLKELLQEFDSSKLESLHQTDELEIFS